MTPSGAEPTLRWRSLDVRARQGSVDRATDPALDGGVGLRATDAVDGEHPHLVDDERDTDGAVRTLEREAAAVDPTLTAAPLARVRPATRLQCGGAGTLRRSTFFATVICWAFVARSAVAA